MNTKVPDNGAKNLLTRYQVHQFVTSSKVLGSPSVESTRTLFVLRLIQTQFISNEKKISSVLWDKSMQKLEEKLEEWDSSLRARLQA